jgi:hypothetical protein
METDLTTSRSRSSSITSSERIDAAQETSSLDLDQKKNITSDLTSEQLQRETLAHDQETLAKTLEMRDKLLAVKQVRLAECLRTQTAFEKATQELSTTQKELDSLELLVRTLTISIGSVNAQIEGYAVIDSQSPRKSLSNTNSSMAFLQQRVQEAFAALAGK